MDTAAPAAGAAKPVAAAKPAPKPAAKPALTFTAQVAPILSRHCGGCHIAGRKGGFQMVSYAGLMKSGMVQPGVGESSRLVEVILSGDMPRGGGKVSPEDTGVLMKWIDAGAPFDGPDPNAPIDAMARQATAPPPAVAPTKPIVAVKLKSGEVSFAADVAPVLVGIALAFAERGHHAEDDLVANAAGHGRLRDGLALLGCGDIEHHLGAEAREGDILRRRPDEAALKGLFEPEHSCAETCAAEQEDMAERADAELLGDAEGEGLLAGADNGKEVGHGAVLDHDARIRKADRHACRRPSTGSG
jgi:hypothetical protein